MIAQAALHDVQQRLRPILMTKIAALVGFLPLSPMKYPQYFAGSPHWQPGPDILAVSPAPLGRYL